MGIRRQQTVDYMADFSEMAECKHKSLVPCFI